MFLILTAGLLQLICMWIFLYTEGRHLTLSCTSSRQSCGLQHPAGRQDGYERSDSYAAFFVRAQVCSQILEAIYHITRCHKPLRLQSTLSPPPEPWVAFSTYSTVHVYLFRSLCYTKNGVFTSERLLNDWHKPALDTVIFSSHGKHVLQGKMRSRRTAHWCSLL
jgi:hypothetical protein